MSVTRFPRALHRAIYVRQCPKGRWYAYVTGYRPAARDTPKVTQHSYETFAEAMLKARALSRKCGLPIANVTPQTPTCPGTAA